MVVIRGGGWGERKMGYVGHQYGDDGNWSFVVNML